MAGSKLYEARKWELEKLSGIIYADRALRFETLRILAKDADATYPPKSEVKSLRAHLINGKR